MNKGVVRAASFARWEKLFCACGGSPASARAAAAAAASAQLVRSYSCSSLVAQRASARYSASLLSDARPLLSPAFFGAQAYPSPAPTHHAAHVTSSLFVGGTRSGRVSPAQLQSSASPSAAFAALQHGATAASPPAPPAGAGAPMSAPDARAVDRRLIAELLKHFKQTAEVRQYLKHYASVDSTRFAIVKISGDLLHDEAETARVASALAFLHRIGLVPVVVHGAGLFTGRRSSAVAAAASAAKAAGADARATLMRTARSYMASANAALVAALRREGINAVGLDKNVFTAAREDADGVTDELRGIVGKITRVSADAITAAVDAGAIPVVASVSSEEEEEVSGGVTFSTHSATMALARVVRPLKVIWLRPEGGLRTTDGTRVRNVNLSDVEGHAALAPSDARGLSELAQLYSVLDEPGCTVSVTSPEHLASELFTHKGAGTLVLRGERIHAHDSLEGLDLTRVRALIQEAFGATLPEDYFTRMVASRRLRRIYVSEDYRGVAVVTEEPGMPGVAYLDKFAVAPSAQGDKLGEVLWRRMTEKEGPLYWRSRTANRVNPWYYEQSTGCFKAKSGDWTVFWRGLEDADVMKAVSTALALPPTFPIKVYPAAATADGTVTPAMEQPVLK